MCVVQSAYCNNNNNDSVKTCSIIYDTYFSDMVNNKLKCKFLRIPKFIQVMQPLFQNISKDIQGKLTKMSSKPKCLGSGFCCCKLDGGSHFGSYHLRLCVYLQCKWYGPGEAGDVSDMIQQVFEPSIAYTDTGPT